MSEDGYGKGREGNKRRGEEMRGGVERVFRRQEK